MSFLARFGPGAAVTGPIIQFLVQSSVIIVLAAICGSAVLRRRAEARHTLWLWALFLVLICPAATAVAERLDLGYRVLPAAISELPASLVASDRPIHGATVQSEPMVPPPSSAVSDPERTEPLVEVAAMAHEVAVEYRSQPATVPEVKPRGRALTGGQVLLWAAGALAGLVRLAVGWRRLARVSRSGRPVDRVRHAVTFERVGKALGGAPLPPVLASPAVGGPVAIGLLRPRVVLPEGLADAIPGEALRDVLVHECAHILRFDAWVGFIQRIVGVLLWPHLLVHYLNGQLARAREETCDNHVLRCVDAPSYARTLLALTEHCMCFGRLQPGLGLLRARWTLSDRVAGLLDPRRVSMRDP